MTPQQRRQKVLETVLTLLLSMADREPVLLILEDVHWSDPTTLEFLELLIAQTPMVALYVLLTCRPAFQPSWSHRSYLTEVTVHQLSQSQVERMAEYVASGKRLPAEVLHQVVEKTDGVPLYVEEMTKAVLESGFLKEVDDEYELIEPLSSLSIPPTLHDSLMARLDRLGTAKGVAQYGSVIGRQFSYELLQSVCELDDEMLQRELGRLVAAELVYQRGVMPQSMYLFKHALVQETAYESLLKRARQSYHQRIAHILESRFPEIVETQPEVVAHHYTEAGLAEPAIGYWQRAGQLASERSANQEAMSHLRTGLSLLRSLPETLARHQQELPLQIALGAASLIAKGYAAPEVEAAYTRARVLCQQLGDIQDVFPVLCGLWRFYGMRSDFSTARPLGEDLLVLAERRDETLLHILAHYALGVTCFHLGELLSAHRHVEEGVVRDTPAQPRPPLFRAGHDPGIACRSLAACTLWLLGYPDQALARAHEGLALATEFDHPFSYGYTLVYASIVCKFRREVQDVYDYAEAAVTLSTEPGFTVWLASGIFFRGWALTTQGQGAEGLRQMHQGFTDFRATGAELFVPYFLSLLAEGYGALKQVDEGLDALKEGWEVMERTGEHLWQAEVHRLKGDLLLHQATPNVPQAESCFQQALDVSRQQHAKSLELRAATSLARLWRSQDKQREAHDLLALAYGWFTEGFGTADLQDAKTLLDELSADIRRLTG